MRRARAQAPATTMEWTVCPALARLPCVLLRTVWASQGMGAGCGRPPCCKESLHGATC